VARARKARIPGLIRTAPEMVDGYELALKLSGKVRPDPMQLARQKTNYSKVAEIIQPPKEVVLLARKLAPGSHKTALLNLWRRARTLKEKSLNEDDTVSGIRDVIDRNKIPRKWAEPMLLKAGYTADEAKAILDKIYGAGGVAGAPATPPGM